MQLNTNMLTKGPDDIPALLCPSRVLQQLIHNTLFDLPTASPLRIGYLNKSLIHTFNREWLGLPEGKTLPLLSFKSNIACVSDLVVEGFQRPVV